VVVAVLYLAALVLSRRRPRITVIIGAVLAANALLVAWALAIGRQLFVNQLAGTVFGPASTVFYDTLLSYLERGQQVLLWLGLILVVVGWFAGRNRSGAATRAAVTGGLETVGSALADTPVAGTGRWVAANARWLRIVIGALGVVVNVEAALVRGARGGTPRGHPDSRRRRRRVEAHQHRTCIDQPRARVRWGIGVVLTRFPTIYWPGLPAGVGSCRSTMVSACRWTIFQAPFSRRKIIVTRRTCCCRSVCPA
jgi:hypothetical protein